MSSKSKKAKPSKASKVDPNAPPSGTVAHEPLAAVTATPEEEAKANAARAQEEQRLQSLAAADAEARDRAKSSADAALVELEVDFLKDVPPEAAAGAYSATARDRWHGKVFPIFDGEHATSSGWHFQFAAGALVGARFEEPKAGE